MRGSPIGASGGRDAASGGTGCRPRGRWDAASRECQVPTCWACETSRFVHHTPARSRSAPAPRQANPAGLPSKNATGCSPRPAARRIPSTGRPASNRAQLAKYLRSVHHRSMLRGHAGKRRRHPNGCEVASRHEHSFGVQAPISVRDALFRGPDPLADGLERWRLTRRREMTIYGRPQGHIKCVVHTGLAS